MNAFPAGARCAPFGAGQLCSRRAGGQELEHILSPDVGLHAQLHPDDPVRPEVLGLCLHPRHRELARVVHRLGQHPELLVLAPSSQLDPDVVDRRSDDEAERLEAGLAEQDVLGDGQVGREDAARVGAGRVSEAAVRRLRLPGRTAVGRVLSEERHRSSLSEPRGETVLATLSQASAPARLRSRGAAGSLQRPLAARPRASSGVLPRRGMPSRGD